MPTTSLLLLVLTPFVQAQIAPLSDYSSSATNLTDLMERLVQSAASGDPQALAELGEAYLFGFPLSPDNPILQEFPLPGFVSQDAQTFARNYTRAVEFLRQAEARGVGDASALLGLVMKLGLLLEEFEGLVPAASDFREEFSRLHSRALSYGSSLAKAELLAGHQQCELLQETYLPEFLDATDPAFYKIPYFDEWDDCLGTCNSVVYIALELASDAVKHYQEKGGAMNYDIGSLQDVAPQVEKTEATQRVAMLKGEAAAGDPHATANLADNYLFGNTEVGIDRLPGEAVHFYEQAAGDGNMMAMQNLGILYLQGIGREKNYTLARRYLEGAADAGLLTAYSGLGFIYQHGLGVEANSTKAFQYFKIAADAGYMESQSNLGIFYLHGDGVEQDFDLAYAYFDLASRAGHLPATFNLGIMHLNGFGTKRSCRSALSLFTEVLRSGELGVTLQQAYYFYKYQDYEGAFLRFAQAASLGFLSGMLSAGYMWEHKLAPFHCKRGREHCEAQFYAQAVLQADDFFAYYRLGDLAYYGNEHFNRSLADALQMYEEADYIPEARFALAYMYEHGEGTAYDFEAARQVYSELISGAESGLYSKDTWYPAFLSLLFLRLKETLGPLFAWLLSTEESNGTKRASA